MAITYTKPLKSVVFTLVDASTVTAADTATYPIGSEALGMYLSDKMVTVPGESSITYFHASQVVKAVVTVTQSDSITKEDPYCGE